LNLAAHRPQPNGKPADGTNGTPKSPVTGGLVLGGGFGIDADPNGNLWEGNFGWEDLSTWRPLRSVHSRAGSLKHSPMSRIAFQN